MSFLLFCSYGFPALLGIEFLLLHDERSPEPVEVRLKFVYSMRVSDLSLRGPSLPDLLLNRQYLSIF